MNAHTRTWSPDFKAYVCSTCRVDAADIPADVAESMGSDLPALWEDCSATYGPVDRAFYAARLADNWTGNIAASLTDYRDPADIPTDATVYGMRGLEAFFIVTGDGELIGVWSAERGHGDDIVAAAIDAGATHLDCFDGYLPTFYGRHGFRETRRDANWTPGGPDVVYMTRD